MNTNPSASRHYVLLGIFVCLTIGLLLPTLISAQDGSEPAGAAPVYLSFVNSGLQPSTVAAWQGEYFANPSLAGEPVLVREEESLAFDWGDASPDPALPADDFSVRWTGDFPFEAGDYRFQASTDNSVRVFLDGTLIIEQQNGFARQAAVAEGPLAERTHQVVVEYTHAQGAALVEVTWQKLLSEATAVCTDALINGGFESNTGWIFRGNPVLAGYATSPVLSGQRSLRTGIPAGGANVESYSPAEQAVTIPSWAVSAQLRFSRYNVLGETAAAGAASIEEMAMPATEAELAATSFTSDFFYVIAIRSDGTIDWLLREQVNNLNWREVTLNLAQYKGQTVRLQFGTYNNGLYGISRTVVDAASLVVCW